MVVAGTVLLPGLSPTSSLIGSSRRTDWTGAALQAVLPPVRDGLQRPLPAEVERLLLIRRLESGSVLVLITLPQLLPPTPRCPHSPPRLRSLVLFHFMEEVVEDVPPLYVVIIPGRPPQPTPLILTHPPLLLLLPTPAPAFVPGSPEFGGLLRGEVHCLGLHAQELLPAWSLLCCNGGRGLSLGCGGRALSACQVRLEPTLASSATGKSQWGQGSDLSEVVQPENQKFWLKTLLRNASLDKNDHLLWQ